MTLATDPDVLTPSEPREEKSSALVRSVAGVGGLVVLAGTVVISVGTMVLALMAMAVVAAVHRKRGRALTRSGHWVVACTTMGVLVFAFVGTQFASTPRRTIEAAKQSMDSSNAAAAKQKPPTWVEKLYPQYREAANAKPSPAMVWMTAILGFGMVVGFFGLLYGTLTWGTAMLLGLALTGRWPGARGGSFEELAVDLPAP